MKQVKVQSAVAAANIHIIPQRRAEFEFFSSRLKSFSVDYETTALIWDNKGVILLLNNQNGRVKKGFRILSITDELIETHKHIMYNNERSTFIDEAVKYYCAFLDGESNQNILSSEVIRIIKASVKDSENHIASMLFKVAGELALQSFFIGEMGLDLSDEEISKYRNEAYNIIRKHHGMMYLEDALNVSEN